MILISNLLEDLERAMIINMTRGKREALLQREAEAAEVMGSFRNRSSCRTEKLKGAKVPLHTERQGKKWRKIQVLKQLGYQLVTQVHILDQPNKRREQGLT